MSILRFLKGINSVRKHVSAGPNASPLCIIRQALPYYFSKSGFSHPPLSVFFIINSSCNLRCMMCDVGQKNKDSMFYKNLIGRDGQDMLITKFKSIIDEISHFQPFISVTSTEPLLYPNIMDAIEHVVQGGLKMNITTNGYLLKRYAEDLAASGLQRLTISLDGPPDIHDNIRGMKGAYQRALEGIHLLHECKIKNGFNTPEIFVNSTISDINTGHLQEFVDGLPLATLKQVGFMTMVFCTKELANRHNAVYGNQYRATETCLSGGMNPAKVDVDLLFSELKMIKDKYGDKVAYFFPLNREILNTYFKKPDAFINGNKCIFPWYSAQLTSSGDMVGLTRCYNNSFGNINEKSFMDIWNGKKMREFRLDLKKHKRFPACSRCEGVLYI